MGSLRHTERPARSVLVCELSVCPGRPRLLHCDSDSGFLQKRHVRYLTTACFKSLRCVGSAVLCRPYASSLYDDGTLFSAGSLHVNPAPCRLCVVSVHCHGGGGPPGPRALGWRGYRRGGARRDRAAGAASVGRFSFSVVVFVNTSALTF